VPVLIAAGIRSPFTHVEGALAGWHPVDLTAAILRQAVETAETDTDRIDEVFVGCAEPVGAQGADMARAAVLAAGWPDRIGGVVVDRAESSGSAALHLACAAIESGELERAVVVGTCVASVVSPGASALARTYGRPWGDGPAARVEDEGGLLPAAVAADRAASIAGIGRIDQDAWATGSHDRRGLAQSSAIRPVEARPGGRVAIQRGTPVTFDDPRPLPPDAATLPPSFDPDGAVTGFTFAPPIDGVTALVLAAAGSAQDTPAIIGRARSAGHPLDPTGGASSAIDQALKRAGVTRDDIGRWEVAETTAAAALLVCEHAQLDRTRVNINGGTLGVGDGGAAEELRLIVDGAAHAESGELVAAVAYGPSGAAATIMRCP
jgi:acetyl-CoA acyltransferase